MAWGIGSRFSEYVSCCFSKVSIHSVLACVICSISFTLSSIGYSQAMENFSDGDQVTFNTGDVIEALIENRETFRIPAILSVDNLALQGAGQLDPGASVTISFTIAQVSNVISGAVNAGLGVIVSGTITRADTGDEDDDGNNDQDGNNTGGDEDTGEDDNGDSNVPPGFASEDAERQFDAATSTILPHTHGRYFCLVAEEFS